MEKVRVRREAAEQQSWGCLLNSHLATEAAFTQAPALLLLLHFPPSLFLFICCLSTSPTTLPDSRLCSPSLSPSIFRPSQRAVNVSSSSSSLACRGVYNTTTLLRRHFNSSLGVGHLPSITPCWLRTVNPGGGLFGSDDPTRREQDALSQYLKSYDAPKCGTLVLLTQFTAVVLRLLPLLPLSAPPLPERTQRLCS